MTGRFLSVEKEPGITPLPLSAEFSPFLIPLMVELVSAGFAATTTERTPQQQFDTGCQQDEAAA